ncbi:unnamed protein product [Coccothraustes coccothraustes]
MPDRIAATAAAGEARGPPALPPRETHLPSPPLPRFHPHRRASERVPPLPPSAQAEGVWIFSPMPCKRRAPGAAVELAGGQDAQRMQHRAPR